MRIVSITHASDIDGVGSAALIKMRYGMDSSNAFFTDYSLASLRYVHDSIRKIASREKDVMLFLTDLGMNRVLVREYESMLKAVKARGWKVVWFDHHVWGEAEVRRIAGLCDLAIVGENPLYCATEITQKNLRVPGRFAASFVRLVHYSDFNRRPRDSGTGRMIGIYAMSITSYNNLGSFARRNGALRHMVDVIAGGRYSDGRIAEDARAFQRLNDARIGKMLKGLVKVGEDACLGFSESVQSTRGCAAIMERTGADICICIDMVRSKASVRSRKADCTLLAASFGGGGHPHAAGFPVDSRRFGRLTVEGNRKRLAEHISRRIAELY
ncbi:MAG TPA: hypothetical protein VL945_01430 [Candidatus Saccharimonadales bacterium]|nr:hypothetical protein [Candidatus Saccharimonadales bacterium]